MAWVDFSDFRERLLGCRWISDLCVFGFSLHSGIWDQRSLCACVPWRVVLGSHRGPRGWNRFSSSAQRRREASLLPQSMGLSPRAVGSRINVSHLQQVEATLLRSARSPAVKLQGSAGLCRGAPGASLPCWSSGRAWGYCKHSSNTQRNVDSLV